MIYIPEGRRPEGMYHVETDSPSDVTNLYHGTFD